MQLDRRHALAALAATAAALPLQRAGAIPLKSLGPISGQASALRPHLIRDFDGTLRVIKALGFDDLEMISFPGWAGSPRGDTGPLATMAAPDIGRRLRAAGLTAHSCHFMPEQFAPDKFAETIAWARAIGTRTLILAQFEMPATPAADDARRYAAFCKEAGTRAKAAGFDLAIHTAANFWKPVAGGGGTAADVWVANVGPEHCNLQLDFGSVVQAGQDGAALITKYAARIHSIHLRDAKPPQDPTVYLPAVPLGEGSVDWKAVMRAAKAAGVKRYMIEMQIRPLVGVFDALQESMAYLAKLDIA